MYSLASFGNSDQNQYFGGAYVPYRNNGTLRSGRILSCISNTVLLADGDHHVSVPVQAVEWDGLQGVRCFSMMSNLVFMSSVGARTTKKPPTTDNTVALIITQEGRKVLYGRGCRHGRINNSMLRSYVDPSPPYPESYEALSRIIRHGVRVVALANNAGLIANERTDKWELYVDQIKVAENGRLGTGEVHDLIQEILNG